MRDCGALVWGLSVTLSLATTIPVNAQLIPDNTLGKENSVVNSINSLQKLIDGGAIRGSNLFHSFKEFNIDAGKSVYFSNPSAIQNILTRVTGKNHSAIFGKLGVNGNANLFLINPNGIIFGENARLDISGSFSATTSPGILFNNGFEFSATNPESPPLLKINLIPGLQYPRDQQADIISQGNLTVGKDLNLVGKNLNLTGELNAGSDLKLQARDTLNIRDSNSSHFIANAGNDLLLQGNQTVDIFVLNHPQSGLFSGNDLILQSENPVLGDARYFSGGSFKIEQLDGNLGSLESPNDPIIRADGDVSFDSYTGASLHILAGGSVNITGDVTITGADTDNGLEETITVSNGENLEIDGKNQATLDIRAGTLERTPGITVSGTGIVNLNTGGSSNTSDIVIGGNIKVDSADGLVFLTNQYNRDTSLGGGNIQIGDIDTSSISGNGGKIILDSRGDIDITNANTISSNGTSQAGNISINATGKLELSSQITANSSIGSGGNIFLGSGSTISMRNAASIDSESNQNDTSGILPQGGDIKFVAPSILLEDGSRVSVGIGGSGKGGDLIVEAGDIKIFDESSLETYTDGLGDAGDLLITTDKLSVNDGSFIGAGTANTGQGGTLTVKASDSVEIIGISADGTVASNLNTLAEPASTGNAGTLTVETKKLTIQDGGQISASTTSTNSGEITLKGLNTLELNKGQISASTVDGVAGDIIINAIDSINLSNNSTIASVATGEGIAGNLTITANSMLVENKSQILSEADTGVSGSISLQDLKTLQIKGNSSFSATTEDGQAGSITINANDEVTVENKSTIASGAVGTGNAGFLKIITEKLTISDDSKAIVSTLEIGESGLISIQASDLNLTNKGAIVAQNFSGDGGNIELENLNNLLLSQGSFISAKTVDGTAGNIEINATDSVQLENRSILTSEAIGNGQAGNIAITTNQLKITDSSQANVSSKGNGDAGSVYINASDVLLILQSEIAATTVFGDGGDIDLQNLKTLQLIDDSLISASTTDGISGDVNINTTVSVNLDSGSRAIAVSSGSGKAGNIAIITPQLNIDNDALISVSNTGTGNAGELRVNASKMKLDNQSKIFAETLVETPFEDDGGDIRLENLKTLELDNGSSISASTVDGEGGNFSITATESITLNRDSKLVAEARGDGEAGELNVSTPMFVIDNGSLVSVSSLGNGVAGDLKVSGGTVKVDNQSQIVAKTPTGSGGEIELLSIQNLLLSNTSEISASTDTGEAGDVIVNATDSIQIDGNSTLGSQASGEGNAGFLQLITNKLILGDESKITVSSKGNGDAGSILINARDVNLTNQAKISGTTESGFGDRIILEGLNSLKLSDSEISASTVDGIAGDLNINATDSVELTEKGSFSVQSTSGGIAGSVTVNTTQFNIKDDAQVTVSSPSGQAGDLDITAENLFLTQGKLTAETGIGDSSEGANITLNIQDLLWMQDNSLISAEAFDTANGGNITINNPQGFVIGLKFENSDIVANATQGNGGNINITTQNIFGLEFRDQRTSYSDITASSKFGVSGQVTINQLNVNPPTDLGQLSSTLVETTAIKPGCSASMGNNFIVSGRGGLPQNPDDLFDGNTTVTELLNLVPIEQTAYNHSNDFSEINVENKTNQIVEATGWIVDGNGNVIFVAKMPENNQSTSRFASVSCEDFSAVSK